MGAIEKIMDFQDEKRDRQVSNHTPQQKIRGPRLARSNTS